jgi:hypothetical protein
MEVTLDRLLTYHQTLEIEISGETDPAFREYLQGRLEHNKFILWVLTNGVKS